MADAAHRCVVAGRPKRAGFRDSVCPTTWVTAIRIAVTPSGGYAGGWETTTTWVVFADLIVEFPTNVMTYVCLPAVVGVSAKLNDPSAAAEAGTELVIVRQFGVDHLDGGAPTGAVDTGEHHPHATRTQPADEAIGPHHDRVMPELSSALGVPGCWCGIAVVSSDNDPSVDDLYSEATL